MTVPFARPVCVAALSGAALLALAAPQAFAATDVKLSPSSVSSTLQVTDMTKDDDAIVISVSANTIVVDDTGTGGVTTADLECTPVSATRVTCPLDPLDPAPPLPPSGQVHVVTVETRKGTDSFSNLNFTAEVRIDDEGAIGNKTISSGPGDDDVRTGDGNDVVDLGSGENTARTGAGNDTITGGPGEDDIAPEIGQDVAHAGAGVDDIDDEGPVSDGPDLLDGGPGGDDEIEYDGGPVTITIDGVADDGHAGEGDNLIGFEDLNGTSAADRMVGSAAADEIFSDEGDDTVAGGPGDDELGGNEGDDSVDGGEGADRIEGGGSSENGADLLNGGPGGDFLEYFGREAVSFTLNGQPDDGRAGERDNVSNIEGVEGSQAADTLVGDGGSNLLLGAGGNDTITGGGGNDAIGGGEGDDLLLALGGRDDVRCGLGFDTPIHDAADLVAGGCERRGAEVVSEDATAGRKGAKVKLACPAEEGATCKGKLVLVSNGKQLGSGKFKVPAGKTGSATVKLTKKGKKALAGASLRVSAEAKTTEPQGTSTTASPLALDAKAKGRKRR